MSDKRTVDFGSDYRNRLASSIEGWMPQLRLNLPDIYANPWSKAVPEKLNIGVAVAAGPSVEKNVHLLKNRDDLVVSCADRAAATYGHLFPRFYACTSDQSPKVAEFYQTMPRPVAAILSIYSDSSVVKVLREREIKRYYYIPALFDEKEGTEFKLMNKMLEELTGCPLVYGISDSGSLSFRVLTGLGVKVICLVGFDYGEPVGLPFEKWTLYPTYKAWGKDTFEKAEKWGGIQKGKHSVYGTEFFTDSSWDVYRKRLYFLLEHAFKQDFESRMQRREGPSM